jgi:hypothetical protein
MRVRSGEGFMVVRLYIEIACVKVEGLPEWNGWGGFLSF